MLKLRNARYVTANITCNAFVVIVAVVEDCDSFCLPLERNCCALGEPVAILSWHVFPLCVSCHDFILPLRSTCCPRCKTSLVNLQLAVFILSFESKRDAAVLLQTSVDDRQLMYLRWLLENLQCCVIPWINVEFVFYSLINNLLLLKALWGRSITNVCAAVPRDSSFSSFLLTYFPGVQSMAN